MDAVLQIFKRSICPGTPFFESLAKKPPTTMDDLFRRANKYSMLEDDVRAATQQVLVAGRPSKACPTSSGLDPLERTHLQGIVAGDVPSTKIMAIQQRHAIFPVFGRKAHKSRAFEAIPPQILGRTSQHNNLEPLGPQCPKAVITILTEVHLTRSMTLGERGKNCCEPHQYANASTPSGRANWRGPSPHRWNNHFSTSRSHPDTTTTSRRPHLVPGNWGLRCAAYLS
ncbi:hypothetical protein CK203_094674 [Vitis vinifera]|uniref:Uncharacterized protein n=1 Tax=Vitis vinifera TaxID=29760 RepID=A0A438CL14_VITVI|nr:hypothetical protein CK203_094674 [Vitis vinifera]